MNKLRIKAGNLRLQQQAAEANIEAGAVSSSPEVKVADDVPSKDRIRRRSRVHRRVTQFVNGVECEVPTDESDEDNDIQIPINLKAKSEPRTSIKPQVPYSSTKNKQSLSSPSTTVTWSPKKIQQQNPFVFPRVQQTSESTSSATATSNGPGKFRSPAQKKEATTPVRSSTLAKGLANVRFAHALAAPSTPAGMMRDSSYEQNATPEMCKNDSNEKRGTKSRIPWRF